MSTRTRWTCEWLASNSKQHSAQCQQRQQQQQALACKLRVCTVLPFDTSSGQI
jgi:hypothetical protein